MVAPNNHWRFQFAIGDHFIKRHTETMAVAQTDPTNPRRKTLERNAFARHIEPVVQMLVVWQQLFDLLVRLINIFRVTR